MTANPIPPSPSRPATILIQTTIAATPNDWHVGRFHHLSELLANERDAAGQPRFRVLARDREPGDGPDSVLSTIDTRDIDVLFLFAVDTGNGLHPAECAAIERFRQRGGGVLLARDHMDLGSSLCGLADIGDAHHFHSKNPEADASRHVNDDVETAAIGWPNYHSGRNGDFQTITVCGPAIHPVLANPANPGGAIDFFPSHPHEGAISAPPARQARVIATGRSLVTGNAFNLIVAFESAAGRGPALAHSSFHHFADYNWDCSAGCPDFVSEAPGEAMANTPQARADIERYVVNAAGWLAGGQ